MMCLRMQFSIFHTIFVLWLVIASKLGNSDLIGEEMGIAELNTNFHQPPILNLVECQTKQGLANDNCIVGNESLNSNCIERLHSFKPNEENRYLIVTAESGKQVSLQCHFCNELIRHNDSIQRTWYYYENFLSSKKAKIVPRHLEYAEKNRKFIVDHEWTLTIRNFTSADGVFYSCRGLEEILPNFDFMVDMVVSSTEQESLRGDFGDYLEYKTKTLDPINEDLVKQSRKSVHPLLSKNSLYIYTVSHQFGDWGKCNRCGREVGIQIRRGKCILSIPTLLLDIQNGRTRNQHGFNFSCHSPQLRNFFRKELTLRVNGIKDFIEQEECDTECHLPIARIVKDELGKHFSKNSLISVIATLGHPLTLVCANDAGDDVIWFHGTQPMNQSGNTRINTGKYGHRLHFSHVEIIDEEVYSCVVNDQLYLMFHVEIHQHIVEPPNPGCLLNVIKFLQNGKKVLVAI